MRYVIGYFDTGYYTNQASVSLNPAFPLDLSSDGPSRHVTSPRIELPLEKKRYLPPEYPWSFLGEATAENKRRLELRSRHVMTWLRSRRLFRGFISGKGITRFDSQRINPHPESFLKAC
jgi:hypothetical protein